ncbi:MAG: hypothetical protein AMXMBFR84_19700 [Candidatus Hydrogenedentota bacterium]
MIAALGLPMLASKEGAEVDRLMLLVHLFMAVLFVGWLLYGVFILWRFRRSRNPKADPSGSRSRASYYIEMGVVAVEVLLLVAFSIPFWVKNVAALPSEADNPVIVRVVAQQYAWNVHYPGPDGLFGRTSPELMDDETNPVGLDREDEHAADDVVKLNQLYLPIDRRALIYLASKDVIHSFALPEFRVKKDVVPGTRNFVTFTPSVTTADLQKQTGDLDRTFEIACAQLCGLGHYRMRGFLFVVTGEEFDQYLKDNAPSGEADPFFL